jgi:two-component system LytT family response regulator
VIRALIVDDEPLARLAIRTMLAAHRDVEIAGECEGGAQAVTAIESLAPDLVFLDIQMPEVDGFAALEALDGERLPRVIFVTAYDQYAVRAFEVRALDYLLKPFDRERFDVALERAREELPRGEWRQRVRDMVAEQQSADRFIVRGDGRVFFVPAAEIDWVEAQGNYVNLHRAGRAHLLRDSMAHLENRLDSRLFRRIHRSTIVNIEAVREVRPAFHGDCEVVLRDGTRLKLSHRYRRNLEKNALGGL